MNLQLVSDDDGGGIPPYPFACDLRLPTHHFFTFEHRRWLNSRLRLMGEPEVRAFAIDLYSICQDQTPVGTLPKDRREIARLLHLSTERFDTLCRHEIGPLYGWFVCDCEGVHRFAHPVVLEMIGEALERQKSARDRSAAGNRRKRLSRLAGQMQKMGAPSGMYSNPAIIEWVDEWLEERCDGNRTATWLEKAMEAHSHRDI
jgi:hypothetical protein